MELNLHGKVVLITGSSRGLGRAMAVRCANEGAAVIVNYHENRQAAEEVCGLLESHHRKYLLVKADVTKESEVVRLHKETLQKFERIDILINNAGKCDDDYIQFMSLSRWQEIINVNLTSAYLCSRVVSRSMIAERKGKIINIASLKGQLGSEGQCNYAASKAGIIGLTKSLAKEMGNFGVAVNAVCPGYITTDLNRGNTNKVQIAERMSTLSYKGALDDFLSFIVLLCSDAICGISGQAFNLDSRIF